MSTGRADHPDVTRWRDAGPQDERATRASSPEERAAALFRRVALRGEPDPAQVEVLRRRLFAGENDDRARSALSGWARPAPGAFIAGRRRWILILWMLAFGGVAVAGYVTSRTLGDTTRPRTSRDRPRSTASVTPPVASEVATGSVALPSSVAMDQSDHASPQPRSPVGRLAATGPAPRRDPLAADQRQATPEPAWSEETRRLFVATARLRRRGQAAAALAEIEAYLEQFPRGVLVAEARLLHVDALLALGRRGDALLALDGLDLQGQPRGLELRLLRAELRARGSCARALADFSAVLSDGQGVAGQLAERALHGRAVCHLRLGDTTAARRDFELYLQQFPRGRHAAEARTATATRAVD